MFIIFNYFLYLSVLLALRFWGLGHQPQPSIRVPTTDIKGIDYVWLPATQFTRVSRGLAVWQDLSFPLDFCVFSIFVFFVGYAAAI